MTPQQTMSNWRALRPQDECVLLNFLAEHVTSARCSDGTRVVDVSDCAAWLRELAECSRAQHGLFLIVEPRQKGQPCPACGHVHQGLIACGNHTSAEEICRCQLPESA